MSIEKIFPISKQIELKTCLFSCNFSVVGPGPHKIESEENEEIPDFQLLPQRDQPAAAAN